jgi:uncharacterized protein YjeT (DUF2065 family)
MKITQKKLRLISAILMITGVIISLIFESVGDYIGIGLIIVGIILLAPWVKEEEK